MAHSERKKITKNIINIIIRLNIDHCDGIILMINNNFIYGQNKCCKPLH